MVEGESEFKPQIRLGHHVSAMGEPVEFLEALFIHGAPPVLKLETGNLKLEIQEEEQAGETPAVQ